MNLGSHLYAQRLHDGQRRLQGRVAGLAEGAVKLLAGKPGLACYLGHPLSAGNDT